MVLDSGLCVENSGNDYWCGMPEDQICRNFTAVTLNQAITHFDSEASLSDSDVICIAAMEGYAFIQTVNAWNTVYTAKGAKPIRVANLRGVSDYTHPPTILNSTDGKYYQSMPSYQWLPIGYGFGGYELAIQTSTLPILSLFQTRYESNQVALLRK